MAAATAASDAELDALKAQLGLSQVSSAELG